MKNLIIIIGTTLLGLIIFNMMVGPGDDSMLHALGDLLIAISGVKK